jgi:hypothetical protein
MEKLYLVFVGGKLAPWELRNKWGSLVRRRKRAWSLTKWADTNGYTVEINYNPKYETQ